MSTIQVAFRLDERLINRIDRFVKQDRVNHKGMVITRSNAVRHLLSYALDTLERDHGKMKKIRK